MHSMVFCTEQPRLSEMQEKSPMPLICHLLSPKEFVGACR